MMKGGIFNRRKPRGVAAAFRSAFPQDQPTDSREKRWLRLVLLVSFVLLTALLTENIEVLDGAETYDLSPGSIALQTWTAEFAFDSEDLEATAKARQEAADAVLDTFVVTRQKIEEQAAALEARLLALDAHREPVAQAVRDALAASTSATDETEVIRQAVSAYVATLDGDARLAALEPAARAAWLMPDPQTLPRREFEPAAEGAAKDTPQKVRALLDPEISTPDFLNASLLSRWAREALLAVLTEGVLDSGDEVRAVNPARRSVFVVRALDKSEETPLASISNLEKAGEKLMRVIRETSKTRQAAETLHVLRDWAGLENAAYAMAAPFLTATLQFDDAATASSRSAARAAVNPVVRPIHARQKLQDAGEYWTEQSRRDVDLYLALLDGRSGDALGVVYTLVAHMVFAALALLAAVRALPILMPRKVDTLRTVTLTLLVVSVGLFVGRVASYFTDSGFLVPTAAGAILLAILLNARVGALAGLLMSVLLSIQHGYDWNLMVVSGGMSLAGAMSISRVRRRSDMAGAGIKATAVGLTLLVAIALGSGSIISEQTFRHLMQIALHGGVCLFLVPGMLSPLERMFGITTDIQLLEYSDLNNEILGRLAIEVPATYAHSLMLGNLAEAASDAIGANGLLARVCAYYHDIGKSRRPEYFSENQTGVNIHEDLSPRLSARAIASHVIEGADMAREMHLPKPLIDAILEHHGTCLISFFYDQAKEQSRHGDIRESDFRYPGPRPQSRETAILMICDAVESGVRSIKNPNEERVREFIDKIIAARSSDRQFDNCDLTLKDLDTIAAVLTQRVISMLHARIAYPDKREDRPPAANVIPMSGSKET